MSDNLKPSLLGPNGERQVDLVAKIAERTQKRVYEIWNRARKDFGQSSHQGYVRDAVTQELEFMMQCLDALKLAESVREIPEAVPASGERPVPEVFNGPDGRKFRKTGKRGQPMPGQWYLSPEDKTPYIAWASYATGHSDLLEEIIEAAPGVSGEAPPSAPVGFWEYLEANYQEVSKWPGWMRGDVIPDCHQPPHVCGKCGIEIFNPKGVMPTETGRLKSNASELSAASASSEPATSGLAGSAQPLRERLSEAIAAMNNFIGLAQTRYSRDHDDSPPFPFEVVFGVENFGLLKTACESVSAFAETLSLTPPQSPRISMTETLTHTRSCPALTPGEDCRCGLEWRVALQTEQTMHAAWRKRAEEAELKLAAPPESLGPRCPKCQSGSVKAIFSTLGNSGECYECTYSGEPEEFFAAPSTPQPAAQGPSAEEIVEMQLALRAADAMAKVADDWVERGLTDSRSALSDALLNYGQPFTYKYTRPASPPSQEPRP